MYMRIFLTVVFLGLPISTSAQDIRSIHPISDVYVAQFENGASDRNRLMLSTFSQRPTYNELNTAIADSERYRNQFMRDGEERFRTFKIIPDGVYRTIYYLMSNDSNLEIHSRGPSSNGDREYVSREFEEGNRLYSCSNFGSEYRLYTFRRNSSEVFLWQNFMIPRNRTYFHIELEEFNRRGSYYLDLGRGQSNETRMLSGSSKFRVRDINQCYGGAWVAIFNNSSEYSGRAFTFQARDLALLWDKIEEYRRDGIYLVDLEKGDIEGSEGGVLWYAIFSDNDRFRNDVVWRVFSSHDDFMNGLNEMRARGYGITDLEISSRGSI